MPSFLTSMALLIPRACRGLSWLFGPLAAITLAAVLWFRRHPDAAAAR